MKNYYRIMLGKKSMYAEEAHKGNFIGAGWLPDIDLTNKLPDNWREFNKKYIPVYLEQNPGKTKVSKEISFFAPKVKAVILSARLLAIMNIKKVQPNRIAALSVGSPIPFPEMR
jgi:hypothetical protein